MIPSALNRLHRSPAALCAALILCAAAMLTAGPASAGRIAGDPVDPGAVSEWTTDSVVTVFLTALADLGVFDEVRFAVDDAGFGEWLPLVPSETVQLPKHDGAHVIHIQLANTLLDPGELGSPDYPLEIDVSTNLDTLGPVTLAPEALSAASGGRATLRFVVRDNLSPTAQVRLRVANQAGQTVSVVKLGEVPTGRAVSRSIAVKLPRGRYRYHVMATDLAGNAQRKAGANDLIVR